MGDKPLLRLLDKAKEERTKEEAKADAYKKRGKSQRDFYTQARCNVIIIDRLIEALKESVVLDDNGKIKLDWDIEYIEALISDVEDPGSVRDKRAKKST